MKFNFTLLKGTLLFLMIGLTSPFFAQIAPIVPKRSIDFDTFLQRLGEYNLEYKAELLELDMALAEEESAKVFPDPTLSFEAADNGQRRMKMGYEFESSLEWTLELGGKRKARINAARSQTDLTRILLAEYFNNLRADASLQFLKTIRERNILNVKKSSYQSMKKLAQSDSIRFALGDIMEIDARQSKLEAMSLFNEVLQQEADWEIEVFEINRLIGYHDADSTYLPQSKINNFNRSYEITELLAQAQAHRNDLKAAFQNKQLSQAFVNLVKAERNIDVDLSIGVGNTTVVSNSVAPTPSMTSVIVGIAIPLKFSNRNKGDLRVAQYALAQSEIHYKNAEMGIKSEVYQAFSQFQTSKKQIEQFDAELSQSAQRILDGKTYSYKRGETSLLEVLDAQRTFNEVQESYFETLFNYGSALIELQRVVGIWDITL